MAHPACPWAALALIAMPTALAAQSPSAEGDVQVVGRVAPICMLGDPADRIIDLGTLIDTSGPRVGRMAAIAPRTVVMPGSFCNYGNTMISIRALALVEQGTTSAVDGFSRAVNYRVTVSPWASVDAVVTTNAPASGDAPPSTGTSASQPVPKLTDLSLRLSDFSTAADALLVAGSYSGLIIITLGPAGQGN